MRFWRHAKRNIFRYWKKSLLNFGICVMAVLLLNLYLGNLYSSTEQLEKLPEAMPVAAMVSNLCGSQTIGLEISRKTLDGIRSSQYVKDPVYSMQLAGVIGEIHDENWKEYLNIPITAVNCREAVFGLMEENIRLEEGVGTDFLKGEEPYLLAEPSFLQREGLQAGDEVPMTIFYYVKGQEGLNAWDYLTTERFRIVGTMEAENFSVDRMYMDAALPWGWAEKHLLDRGIEWVADSMSFELRDASLLNAFKQEMKDLKMLEVNPASEPKLNGIALIVRDENFISSATRLRENISLLKSLFPIVLLVVLCAGATVSWLLVQSRRRDYALMRAAGAGRAGCFFQLFTEYLTVEAAGAGAGLLASFLWGGGSFRTAAETFAIFIACYLCGTAAALWVMSRTGVMAVLTGKE